MPKRIQKQNNTSSSYRQSDRSQQQNQNQNQNGHHQQQQQQQQGDQDLDDDHEMKGMKNPMDDQEMTPSLDTDTEEDDYDMNEAEDDPGFMLVDLAGVEKLFRCPICLDIISQTRIVTECLHRFCKECIDKAMRTGKHECPACRTHVSSKRSLRADERYDSLIQAFYPNIKATRGEAVEMTQEEKEQNAETQASFSEIRKRQLKAKRRERGRSDNISIQEPNNDENVEEEDSSPAIQPIMVFGSEAEPNENDTDTTNEVVARREILSPANEIGSSSGGLSWGKNAQRSRNIPPRDPGSSSRSIRGNRLTNLVNHLRGFQLERDNMDELEQFIDGDEEVNIVVALISLDEDLPSLEQEYLSLSPVYPIKTLRKRIAGHLGVQVKKVQLLHVTDPYFPPSGGAPVYDPSRGPLRLLESDETVGHLQPNGNDGDALVLGYRHKGSKQ